MSSSTLEPNAEFNIRDSMLSEVDEQTRKANKLAEIRNVRQILNSPENEAAMNATTGYVMGKFRKHSDNCISPTIHPASMYALFVPPLNRYRSEHGYSVHSSEATQISKHELTKKEYQSNMRCKKHKPHRNGRRAPRICEFENICVRDGRLFTLNTIDSTRLTMYSLPTHECVSPILVPGSRQQALSLIVGDVTVVDTPTILFSMRGIVRSKSLYPHGLAISAWKYSHMNLLLTSLGVFDAVHSEFGEDYAVGNSTMTKPYSAVMIQNALYRGSQRDLWAKVMPWFKKVHSSQRPLMFLHEFGGTTCFRKAILGSGGAYQPLYRSAGSTDKEVLARKYPKLHQRMATIVPKFAAYVADKHGSTGVKRHTALLHRNKLSRRILNEAEVSATMAQLGYHVSIVDFNTIPLSDQVRLVRSTELLVGLNAPELDISLFLNRTHSALIELIGYNATSDIHSVWMQYADVPYVSWRNEKRSQIGHNEVSDSYHRVDFRQYQYHLDQWVDPKEVELLCRTSRAVIARHLGRPIRSRQGLGSVSELTSKHFVT
ncbi:hypothetical protein SARC_00241 [Sphaeroforma arctica JP610]|uniref:Glycosyltransferase 61 catalytic domain-containing protein n=1 Tax=Sphaeroforma arctica JP610 TaxID=667725 RepID=A0A0L0GF55_9EUKA|nr:hypothetical protein SARC_00241 [Sphaeroforma arctica JP610]KNC87670.1 hypothetical protein SARC_00241 [Sphaeroforma arctica JP610]|eukprot:XP_014161572.1 hypothetical protein SARC_00241 [Sphaeroforma arctica JP610]